MKVRIIKLSVIIFLTAILAAACSKVPSRYIQPEEMAQLMADIHTAEAVVESNRGSYMSDSAKLTMKQSVYLKHGVDGEKVDSSLAWYGRNITYYMDVYDRTIEILEQRLAETGSRVAAEEAMSLSGDSVDVWTHPRFISFTRLSPTPVVVFSYRADENWQRGDVYQWRLKGFNVSPQSRWTFVTEYDNGKVEKISRELTRGDGWQHLAFYTDSTVNAVRVAGVIEIGDLGAGDVRLDSVELIRRRVEPANYSHRYDQYSITDYFSPDSI